MRDILLEAAGITGVITALFHGVLGETILFARARIEPPRSKLLIRLGWQIGAVGWATYGILLLTAPFFGSQSARTAIVIGASVTYLFGALANAFATGGRHFGWVLLTATTALAIAGR